VEAAGPDGSTLNQGLVSWWRGEGNANDSVGPNNGTIQGGVTFVPGKVGQAFEFDGTSGDILIPTSTTLNLVQGYTIAFWIMIPALPSQEIIIMSKFVADGENKTVTLEINGTIGFFVADTSNVANTGSSALLYSATALSLNTWHQVVATYDGANDDIYIDGNIDASTPSTGNVFNSTGALSFAHNATVAPSFFAGSLNDIRWYSRALSGAEVAALLSAD
jgi:hypothetical protein